ncbi:MAG: hypothetical protein AAF206_29620, partial [Bacteroidota bacterium]
MQSSLSFHLFGIGLVIFAFVMFGRGIVARSRGKSFNALPALLMILAALAYHFIAGSGGLVHRFAGLTLDFGLGM